MKGVQMMLDMAGIKPDMIQQSMQFLAQVEQSARMMAAQMEQQRAQLVMIREQLIRIEANTLMLLEAASGVAPAAPTDYSVPALPALPPMDHEPRAAVPVGD